MTTCLRHTKRFYTYVARKELNEGIRLDDRVQELLAFRTKAASQPQHL